MCFLVKKRDFQSFLGQNMSFLVIFILKRSILVIFSQFRTFKMLHFRDIFCKTTLYIITPFQCNDTSGKMTDKTIMVNRGFLPDNQLDQNNRDKNSLQSEATTVTGIFRIKGDKPNQTSHYMYNSDESARFNNKHHETMAKFLVEKSDNYDEIVYPFCVDELVDSENKDYDVEGTPVGGQTRLDIPNNHLGYILQWFGLAVAVMYFWNKKLRSPEHLRRLREGLAK